MSDAAPDTGTTMTDDSTDTDTGPDLEAEVAKWQALSRKHEERAKANAIAAKELEQLRQQSMSDQEKAVATARTEARAEVLREVSGKVAAAEIKAAAAGRLSDDQVAALLEGVNLVAFLDDDGEVDSDKVARFVDGIAPKTNDAPGFPDLGQGARTPPHALNGDPLLNDINRVLNKR